MFLAIQDQLNEYHGEFDEEEEKSMDVNEIAGSSKGEVDIAMQRAANKKKAVKREPNIS